MDATNERRIVLLGKTGSGKSSIGNTLLGDSLLNTKASSTSVTSECQAVTKFINGRNITVIDTPGFFDTNRSEEEMKPAIVRCITECAPGPHAFLIVLKVDRFTEQEQAVITKIRAYFSEEALKYAVIVFTHGDQLSEGERIEDFVRQNKNLSDLVEKCGGRCHVLDNKYWKDKPQDEYRSNKVQVGELLNTIDKMVENKGGYYTNEMLQAVEEELQQEEEKIRQLSPNMTREEIRKQAKVNGFNYILIKVAGTATGVLLGAVFGVVNMVGKVHDTLKKQASPKTIGSVEGGAVSETSKPIFTVASAAEGAVRGGIIGYHAADGADTVMEAVKMAAGAVRDEAHQAVGKAKGFINRIQSSPK